MAAADPSNPQSWNRYAYVLNSPLLLVDPFGLDCGGGSATLIGTTGDVFNFKTSSSVPCPDYNLFGDNAREVGFRRKIWNTLKKVAHATICAAATAQIVGAKATSGVVGAGGGGAFGVGAWWGISGSASASLVADPHGNVGVAFSGSFNPGTAAGGVFGAGAAGGYSATFSEAQHISDLNGVGTTGTANAGPVGVSVSTEDPFTVTISGGGGEAGHVSFTAEYGGTVVPQALTTNCSNVF